MHILPSRGRRSARLSLCLTTATCLALGAGGASASTLASFFEDYAQAVDAGIPGTPLPAMKPSDRLSRIAPADYADGVGEPISRPSPRALSNALSLPENVTPDAKPLSNLAVEMMQFLASHEIARSPTGTETLNIPVAADDPVAAPGQPTPQMLQKRSTFEGSPREQLNDVTAIFDGSTVYGSDLATQASLRTNDGTGKLRTSPDGGLPINPVTGRAMAGDVRADENPGLQALHELFMKEHNRVADEIIAQCSSQSLSCSGEEIFQGARQIVAATQEKIFYDELLPLFLQTDDLTSLLPDPSLINDVEGAINSFTAAAGRSGHTQVPDTLRLQLPGEVAREVELRSCFFNPSCLGGASLDAQLYGLSQQQSEPVDMVVIDTLRNAQVPGAGAPELIDLLATNINRGRDHGLPDYLSLREALGFDTALIEDLLPQFVLDAYPDYMTTGVDALVGIFSEFRDPMSYIGETGSALWALQFLSLQQEHTFLNPGNPLEDYLSTVSMAGVIANNTSLQLADLGSNPFVAPVPLPPATLLLGSGLILLLARRRRV